MDISCWLAIAGLLLGSGAGVGLLRFAMSHASRHALIEKRLQGGDERFSRIEGKVDSLGHQLGRVDTAAHEILVKLGCRTPGVDINGN